MTKKEKEGLDELFREYIRKRAILEVGGCEKCLTKKYDTTTEKGELLPAWKQVQTSHYIGHSNFKVRWHPDNAAGVCGACHLRLAANPQEHTEWFTKRLGEERLLLLTIQANQRHVKVDIEAETLYLREQIKKLEGVTDG